MSYKLKLGVAIAVVALALPTLAAAQDPSTRTDITIIGAVSADQVEYVADTNATTVAELPIVYDDEAQATETQAAAAADESTSDSRAHLGQTVESE